MKILWVCNIMLPAIAEELKLPYSNREGWLSGSFERLLKEIAGGNSKIEALGVCFPVSDIRGMERLSIKGVSCYGFQEDLSRPECYDKRLEARFAEIYQDFDPDILHIFGTEFPHGLAAAKSFGKPLRTLVGIQGLCYEIAKVYRAGLPEEVWKRVTFRDFIRKDSLKQQQEKFVIRGENEKKLLGLAGHITGRSRFDREGTARINPGAVYHSMNETMRKNFYTGGWTSENCVPHSIFAGQGDYPLKGFHFLLEAASLLKKRYPDLCIYVAGNSIISHRTLKEKLKLPAYGKYLLKLIHKYGLEEQVISTGKLTAEQMKEQYLKASVFVCASVLENSPNTLGEAMLLGVPAAASFTGGIPDMITDGKEGLLFPMGNAARLAEAIEAYWQEEKEEEGFTFAERISAAERRRALMAHDGDNNYRRLMEIYHDIGGRQ